MSILSRLILFAILIFCSCAVQQEYPQIHFNLIHTIGTNSENAEEMFNMLNDFVIRDSLIYCLDGRDRKIKVFPMDGEFIKTIGSKGQGPNEFVNPRSLAVTQNFIYVIDSGKKKLIRMNLDGEYISSIEMNAGIARIMAFASGNLLLEEMFIDRASPDQSMMKLSILNPELQVVKDSVWSGKAAQFEWIDANPDRRIAVLSPFSPRLQWTIIANTLFVANTRNIDISAFDDRGELLHNRTIDFKPQKVTAADKQNWIDQTLQDYASPSIEPEMLQDGLQKIKFPTYKPVFLNMNCDINDLVIFLQQTIEGFRCMKLDELNAEPQYCIYEFSDFFYHQSRYYRITGGEDSPYTLSVYRIEDKD